jgi:hypothetical protein
MQVELASRNSQLTASEAAKVITTTPGQLLGFSRGERKGMAAYGSPVVITAERNGNTTQYHAVFGQSLESQRLTEGLLEEVAPLKGEARFGVWEDWALLMNNNPYLTGRRQMHRQFPGWDKFEPHLKLLTHIASNETLDDFLERGVYFEPVDHYANHRFKISLLPGGCSSHHEVAVKYQETILSRVEKERKSKRIVKDPWRSFSQMGEHAARIRDESFDQLTKSEKEAVHKEYVERSDSVFFEREGLPAVISTPYASSSRRYIHLNGDRIAMSQRGRYVEGEVVDMEKTFPKFVPDLSTLQLREWYLVPHLIWRTSASGEREIDIGAMFKTTRRGKDGESTGDSLVGMLMLPYLEPDLRRDWEPEIEIRYVDKEGNEHVRHQKNSAIQVAAYATPRSDEIARASRFLQKAEELLAS